jgi:hypothetical protein
MSFFPGDKQAALFLRFSRCRLCADWPFGTPGGHGTCLSLAVPLVQGSQCLRSFVAWIMFLLNIFMTSLLWEIHVPFFPSSLLTWSFVIFAVISLSFLFTRWWYLDTWELGLWHFGEADETWKHILDRWSGKKKVIKTILQIDIFQSNDH